MKIMLEKREDSWYMGCSENLYITSDNILKLASREMGHGDEVLVKYQSSGQEVFRISFMIDFESEGKQYSRAIDIGSRSTVRIGGAMQNDITIKDELMGEDRMVLSRSGDRYVIRDVQHALRGICQRHKDTGRKGDRRIRFLLHNRIQLLHKRRQDIYGAVAQHAAQRTFLRGYKGAGKSARIPEILQEHENTVQTAGR